MGSAHTEQPDTSAARKAHVAELRRAEQARRRRMRGLTVAASVAVAAGLVVGGAFVVKARSGDDGGKADTAAGASADAKNGDVGAKSAAGGRFVTGADGVRTWQGTLSRNHVTTPVTYPMHPPVGGDHNPVWADCNGTVYTDPVKDEMAVHSLEHGAVWVTYTDKAAKSDVAALAERVKSTPYTLMSPYANQSAPIVLSAWGHQLGVRSAADPAVAKFLSAYVQGPQTPEPGASCSSGMMK
ncbi:hypothetical protein C3489_12920 [Streptomyces sp. Ru71]|uniref:DUF3105 domain-containing protein n=1 Tax=Streptomyces sp. Ru71 TaxID=2080746 RepID=UPI000CDD6EB2|nr:DUF3105 domain-containing protein [Streptomyces sp. Ru71]POX54788.1 hypothetical protein C3489_12920 [Streptomyces sp. Ru71]